MEERRKLKRRYIMFYSRVFDRKTGELLGYLADLTTEGAMLISEFPIKAGIRYRLRMDLPEDTFMKQDLSFEARSIWCKPDINPKFFVTGFQLIDLPPQDIDIIEQIIKDYGFRDGRD